MQVISDELKAALERKNPVYKKVVELHRRLWSGGAFVFDTEIDITSEVKQMSEIRWKMDAEGFNVWTLDNTSLVFRNDRNQWKQSNLKGYFPGLYEIADSKIVIKFGAQLADGTFEVLKSFTGYISGDPVADPENKHCTVTIQGGMSRFGKKSAESISTLVTDELLGEDSGTEFTTANNGVGIIVIVKRGATLGAAVEIRPQINYTTADLNKKDLPLKITLISALTAGEKLYCSYRYWYQDKTLEWLAEQIMTLNGITSYAISPAIFQSSIENTWDFNDKAEWDTCTNTNIDTITTQGSFKIGLIDDFGDGDYSANPEWTVLRNEVFSIDSGRLKIEPTTSISVIKTAMTKTVGNWQFKCYSWLTFTLNDYCNIYFMATGEDSTYKYPTAGYYMQMHVGGTRIRRADGTILIDTAVSLSSTDMVRISRNAAGVIKFYVNEVLKGTSAADLTYTTSDRFVITAFEVDDSFPLVFYFDNFYFWDDGTTVGTGVLESTINDCSVDVTVYGKLDTTYTANGATIAIETYSSGTSDFSADNDPAGWVAIGGTGQINSLVKRYLKFRVTATLASLTNPVTPVFDQITLTYYTSTTVIDLVNLTGMTCRQAMEKIAEMPAYEFGFKADETFVYRPRETGVPAVMELRSDSNIIEVKNVSPGIERVYNRVVAEFGLYRKVSDASTDTAPNSIDKYGEREYSVSSSSLLPAENVNLAFAVAPTILSYTKTPRLRCQVESMFLPQLELGDKVTAYFDEPTALRRWHYGDMDVVYGQADLEYYDDDVLENRYNLYNKDMRIEGVSLNPETFMTTLDLVEA